MTKIISKITGSQNLIINVLTVLAVGFILFSCLVLLIDVFINGAKL
jgi:hypothetical protein